MYPQPQSVLSNDYMSKPNRWNGPRGVADKDLTVSEKKCIVAAERNRGHQLSFAERKELMLRFRADMAKFQPATPIMAASALLAVISFRMEGSLPNMPSAVTFTTVLTPE